MKSNNDYKDPTVSKKNTNSDERKVQLSMCTKLTHFKKKKKKEKNHFFFFNILSSNQLGVIKAPSTDQYFNNIIFFYFI